jgi:hypothetical protein
MTAIPRLTRGAFVDVVTHLSGHVCLDPRRTFVVPLPSRVRLIHAPLMPPQHTAQNARIVSPRRRGTWFVAP